jgi:hypothetical protein
MWCCSSSDFILCSCNPIQPPPCCSPTQTNALPPDTTRLPHPFLSSYSLNILLRITRIHEAWIRENTLARSILSISPPGRKSHCCTIPFCAILYLNNTQKTQKLYQMLVRKLVEGWTQRQPSTHTSTPRHQITRQNRYIKAANKSC